ncbi:CocE/NonD family hydrolase [Amycolatopsis acidicola]|uniref:CocE/NonD family hydrolase n=1 Tax=Amycolatopsis acidicola TaxID=2596893 RepID=A0A5N0V2Q2_9PSEU|nr:CocE/NonD family hydrolase [Amycolatopsis acidicola]KAA9160717.1 CocE/NonD family hydrolase [Amycolatopsis acidicola]
MSPDLPALRPASAERLPGEYTREPDYDKLIVERDVRVPMRDGVELCVDIYRPDTAEPLPALLAFAIYNKDIQGPALAEALPPQPSWSSAWCGPQEAGDTRFLVSRGYIHVIGMPRGIGKAGSGGSREWDSYDLIEWIARQPWCDGNVGMVGISGFGAEQMYVARQGPPHLKAIFPFDPRGAYGTLGGFREEYPGGVLHLFRYLVSHFGVFHQDKGAPGELDEQREQLWREAMANDDYKLHPHLYNVVTMKGQHLPTFFNVLIDPYVPEGEADRSEREIGGIDIPVYTGSGWYGYTYKTHLQGAQTYWRHLRTTKKMLLAGPAHIERPFHGLHGEILRWYDHWLKGMDTGVVEEPAVRYWLQGANEWRTDADWPLPGTQWTPFYLDSWERLRTEPFTPSSVDDRIPPDAFVQMPLSQTRQVSRLRFLSAPLNEDLTVVGPSSLKLFASIDAEDTNWIVALSDVGPDDHVQTVREGERDVRRDLPERELTRGWLKASNRALDDERSLPYKPFHKLTRAARQAVRPGEVVEYNIEILATANQFRKGHRICLDVMSMDAPTGVAGATNAEYVPYHVNSAKTTLHKIFHNTRYPSRLLLPVIPDEL